MEESRLAVARVGVGVLRLQLPPVLDVRVVDADLGSHLGKLEEAGYVSVLKGYNGKKPETTVSLTASGRKALMAYRDALLSALAPVGDEAPE